MPGGRTALTGSLVGALVGARIGFEKLKEVYGDEIDMIENSEQFMQEANDFARLTKNTSGWSAYIPAGTSSAWPVWQRLLSTNWC